jgi:hypothetical protein
VARGRGQGHRHRTVLQADNRWINVNIGNKQCKSWLHKGRNKIERSGFGWSFSSMMIWIMIRVGSRLSKN